jgi:hypothetical protein
MAKTIPQLTDATTVNAADELIISQGGITKRATGAELAKGLNTINITINAKDFGAVGDGVADDAAAIQSAVNYASTFTSGATVSLPVGTYRVGSTINITKSGVAIEGSGHGNCWIVNATTNAPAIKVGDGIALYARNAIRNMVFGQASGITAISGNCAILASKCSNLELEDIQAFQFPSQLYDGLILDNVVQSYVSDIGIQNCLNKGMYLHNQTFDVYLSNGRCDANKYGFNIRDCQGIYITNWSCFANTENGWLFNTSGSSANNQFIFCTNCIGDSSREHNWKIEQLSVSTLTTCWAASHGEVVTVFGGNFDGFHLSGLDVEEVSFIGCIAIANNRHGINLDYANRIQIVGGLYGSASVPTAFAGRGFKNGLSGAGSGIHINQCDRITVNGAKSETNSSYGVAVQAGATNVDISSCWLKFNVLGPIQNSANATTHQCRIYNNPNYNPVGFLTTPTIPASGANYTNLFGVDAMVYIVGGSVSLIAVSGQNVLLSSPASVLVPAGSTIALTYSSAPSWQWHGL